jgi:hypothetical protein
LNLESRSDRRKPAMAILETLKKMAEKAPGLVRPTSDRIEELVRIRKPNALKFEDDGIIPNNSRWPFVFYRGAMAFQTIWTRRQ